MEDKANTKANDLETRRARVLAMMAYVSIYFDWNTPVAAAQELLIVPYKTRGIWFTRKFETELKSIKLYELKINYSLK